jgi:hypothetical protein
LRECRETERRLLNDVRSTHRLLRRLEQKHGEQKTSEIRSVLEEYIRDSREKLKGLHVFFRPAVPVDE